MAVVADPDRALKVGIASPHLISHTAICDPELTYSCPPGLTAVSGADALTHAIEAFTTARRQPSADLVHEHVFLGKNALSDHHALLAIGHIAGNLKKAYDNGDDTEARAALMLGATTAGIAFGTAGTALAHAVQYPVGALTHTPHGAGVAVLLPYVMRFNSGWCAPELAEIGTAMGLARNGNQLQQAAAAIEAVEALFSSVGIPRTLADLGVEERQLEQIAADSMGITRLVKNNPRPVDPASMLELVRAAFTGEQMPVLG